MKYLLNISEDTNNTRSWVTRRQISDYMGVIRYTTGLYVCSHTNTRFVGMVIDATDEEMVMLKLKFNIHIAGNSKLLFAQP